MKTETIKRNWEANIRNNIVKSNPYTEKAIRFLNSQNESFCSENKKNTGLRMLVKMQNGLFPEWEEHYN